MRSPPRFRRKYKRRKEATKRFRVIKVIGPSRWLILLVATIRGIVFSWRKARHDNRNIQEAAIVAASGVFFAPPPPFTTCRYSLRSPRLFSIQSHRASSSLAYRSTMFNFLPFQTSSPFPIFLSASCNHLTRCLVWISFENAQHEFPSASSPLFFYSPRRFSLLHQLTHIRRDTELKRRFSALASIVACISSGIVAIGVCRKW